MRRAPTGFAGGPRPSRRAISAPEFYWNWTRRVVASSQTILQARGGWSSNARSKAAGRPNVDWTCRRAPPSERLRTVHGTPCRAESCPTSAYAAWRCRDGLPCFASASGERERIAFARSIRRSDYKCIDATAGDAAEPKFHARDRGPTRQGCRIRTSQ